MREPDGGVNLTEVHCKYMCKCHNESPVQLMYTHKNVINRCCAPFCSHLTFVSSLNGILINLCFL
jgi:hypothetical protein